MEGEKTGFDFKEAKLATYSSSSFNQVCLGTTFENQNTFIVINKTADSMFSPIADNVFRATSLGRDTWKKLFGDKGSLEPYCNNEGFNVGCPSPLARIRIVSNDAQLCTQCGGWIAFGEDPFQSGCMQRASPSSDNGAGTFYAIGYIMVK